MEYITTKEASTKWGISAIRITVLANEGRIPGAQKIGKNWLIPASATKPPEYKSGQLAKSQKESNTFSFPLYHFRPDWNNTKESELSVEQKLLFQAESAVLECRYEDAYSLLESILVAPDSVITEIGCLWYKALCCMHLNKPDEFSKVFFRFQFLLSEDFPNRDDMMVILDALKTYIDTVGFFANDVIFNVNINYQSLPLACIVTGYANLSSEVMKHGAADINLLEINLRFLETTSAVIAIEIMHCHLLGIYSLRGDLSASLRHAEAVIRLTYENNFYFPLVTYYRYFSQFFTQALAKYPQEFQNRCHELITRYNSNFDDFLKYEDEDLVLYKLTAADYPYVFAVLSDSSNNAIADKMGVHPQTVKNKIAKLCKKFDVNNKKELREYLHNYL